MTAMPPNGHAHGKDNISCTSCRCRRDRGRFCRLSPVFSILLIARSTRAGAGGSCRVPEASPSSASAPGSCRTGLLGGGRSRTHWKADAGNYHMLLHQSTLLRYVVGNPGRGRQQSGSQRKNVKEGNRMASKIADIQVCELHPPPPSEKGTPARRPSWGQTFVQATPLDRFDQQVHRREPGGLAWVKVIADDGTWGLGLADTGHVAAILVRECLAPLVVGQEVGAIDLCNDLMWRGTLSNAAGNTDAGKRQAGAAAGARLRASGARGVVEAGLKHPGS